jgi:hypothetical protein
MFFLQQNLRRRGEVLLGSRAGEEVAQIMYTGESKCKNDKIKGEKK